LAVQVVHDGDRDIPLVQGNDFVDVLEQEYGLRNVEVELLKLTFVVAYLVSDAGRLFGALDDPHILR